MYLVSVPCLFFCCHIPANGVEAWMICTYKLAINIKSPYIMIMFGKQNQRRSLPVHRYRKELRGTRLRQKLISNHLKFVGLEQNFKSILANYNFFILME